MNVKELLNFSEEIGEYYATNIEDTLKKQLIDFMDIIEVYFKKKCIEENEVLSNSVYKSILPFSYKTRIKSKESLEEKVIRNDIKFVKINEDEILNKFDDLIGVTILTTTIGYQDLAYRYLKSFIRENTDTIELVSGLDKKKTLFGNKRIEYYHIKLTYKGYPVEIQIKSIFLSAFADIEHTLFYKDHNIHELKSYNKRIMHSLAPILIDLEEILHGIYTHDKTNIKSDILKTTIYNYLNTNKEKIFGIEQNEDKGRLNFILKKASELLYNYYKDKEEEFNSNKDLQGMSTGRDFKIINFLYSDSLQYFVISSILDDQSDFFREYLHNELKNDQEYSEKIDLIDDSLNRFLNTLEYMSDNEKFTSVLILKKLQLKKVFDEFINQVELFDEKFQDIWEDEHDSDFHNFINACLIIPYLIKNKDELQTNIGSYVEQYFSAREENESINLELNERILEYIFEGWNYR